VCLLEGDQKNCSQLQPIGFLPQIIIKLKKLSTGARFFCGRPHGETRQAYLPLTTPSKMMMISHYCQHTQPQARMRDGMGTTPAKSTCSTTEGK